MNCKQTRRKLAFFLENTLSPKQRVEIENHLKHCPACFHLMEEFSELWRASKQPEKIRTNPLFWSKLRQRIGEYETDIKPFGIWQEVIIPRIRPAVAVAAVLICIFLGYFLGSIPPAISGQATSRETVRATALQNFFENHYFNPLSPMPRGSMEATYWNMMTTE
jgi:anti-sigma factor RsiW